MKVQSPNVIDVAIAASLLAGKLDAKNIPSFAKELAVSLQLGDAAWNEAAKKWSGAEQTALWRNKASALIENNRDTLAQVSDAIASLARITGAGSGKADPQLVDDWAFQRGVSGGQRAANISEVIGSEKFLEPGRFSALPDGTAVLPAIEVGKKRAAEFPIRYDLSRLEDPTTRRLSEAMDKQWGFLHERGVEGFVNVNTLTRSAYNSYGVRQILQNLEDRDVKNARVLLVTGYETPIHELLESARIKEVRVSDLSKGALDVVANKYAHHPNASKLVLELSDFSGVAPALQQRAMNALAPSADQGQPPPEATVKTYWKDAAKKENQVALPYAAQSFDAVHLPFVLGAFDLGPVTDAMVRHRAATQGGISGYDDYLGGPLLASKEAGNSVATNSKHVLDEAKRMTKSGGLVVANLWARPQNGQIRFSDTPLEAGVFDKIFAGYQHLFSGNPQPTLPHTVGHIMSATAD